MRMREDGALVVPMRAEAPGIVGDAVRVVLPGEPGYQELLADYEAMLAARARRRAARPDVDATLDPDGRPLPAGPSLFEQLGKAPPEPPRPAGPPPAA